jgi:hypothetical protein
VGLRASFTVLPADRFAALQANPNAEVPPGEEHYDIGKTWFNFHLVFRDETGPLRFIIQGDLAERPLDGNLVLEEDQGEDEGDGAYFAHVCPETVKAVAAALGAFPRWKMMDRLRKANPMWVRHKESRDRFADAFDELIRAYIAAAANGAALQVLIC